jgi:hypothetical protein
MRPSAQDRMASLYVPPRLIGLRDAHQREGGRAALQTNPPLASAERAATTPVPHSASRAPRLLALRGAASAPYRQ